MTQPIPDPNPLDNPEASDDTFREDELIASLWREQRDFMAPYVFERLGTSQQGALAILSDMLSQAQERRHVRAGDAKRMAAMVLLDAQGRELARTEKLGSVPDPATDRSHEYALVFQKQREL